MSRPDTLSKQKLVRRLSQQTRLTNDAVQSVLEALMDAISAHLAAGGRVELENFLVLEVKDLRRGRAGANVIQTIRTVKVKVSRHLRTQIQPAPDRLEDDTQALCIRKEYT